MASTLPESFPNLSKLWQVLTYGERETLLRDLQQAAATLPAPDNALAADPALVLQRAGLDTDPWQTDILRARAQRVLLLCSRQAGKSTVTAAMALWEALYRSPALILLLSPSNRQSGELFRKVVELYQDVGAPVAAEHATTERLELANGSRIISLPGKERTLRGFSGVSLLVIDEAARVPDELYYGVRPMLAVSGGRLVGLSTPWGKRGWFHKEWTEGAGDWQRVKVVATDCPRITPEFLAEERAALGDWWYRQEYLCEFVDTVDQLFSYDEVMAAITPDVLPLFGAPAPTAALAGGDLWNS